MSRTETHPRESPLWQGIGESVRQACGVGDVEQVVMTHLEGGPYKDAVRFANGIEILLQRLDRGLTAAVVALPGDRIAEAAVATAIPEPV